jgi:methylenetetrahydrofolate reductase (NADPH)
MFDCAYLIEILTPLRSDQENVKENMGRFAGRYRRIMDSGCGVSIPDNPMGRPRYNALEAIDSCGLSIDPQRMVMNLNTFHTKDELDGVLSRASSMGVKYLLIIRGDGGPDLAKLNPQSIGGQKTIATSIDLIRYINTGYADMFVTGAAFNPYNPIDFETRRLQQKMAAGAKFIITQPIIGQDPHVDALQNLGIPIVIEAWMSKNIDLLYKSVRKQKDASSEVYDPAQNLKVLHDAYPQNCVYLSMLSFKQDWKHLLPKL